MTILLSDERVRAIRLLDSGEPLVQLDHRFGPSRERVRRGIAARLEQGLALLPDGVGFRVVSGHRSAADQLAIIDWYTAELLAADPSLTDPALTQLSSRFVAPIDVAPHVAGAAIDITLVDAHGRDLDLGTPIDATPEESGGRCFFAAPDLTDTARTNRGILALALEGAGFVNYPTEWWHWSYGDRYWALVTGAPAAVYGSVSTVSVSTVSLSSVSVPSVEIP
jgi:D-alanyl-D-alanine dipeptidase